MRTDNGAGLYIHIPFCARKCDYCDFVSFVKAPDIHGRYFDMLFKEIKSKSSLLKDTEVTSVFIGGGTPSVVGSVFIADLLSKLREYYSLSAECEISIESNPNSATHDKLTAYRQAGINRLSIGLQSADEGELKTLSRLHSYSEFETCFKAARDAGFDNINIDLMSAIPGQTVESYRNTLEKVTALSPEHISAYSLILEEGTPFFERYKDGRELPDEDTDREMYALTKDLLLPKGYSRYEISNYSLKGRECIHNIKYWRRNDYLGFGLAAASLVGNSRFEKHTDLDRYLSGDFSEKETILTKIDQMEEFMFLGLRMTDGIDPYEFKSLFGNSVDDEYGPELEKLAKEELLSYTDRIRLTDRGLDLANYCMTYFIK